MNEISYHHKSSTFSYVLAASLIAAQSVQSSPAQALEKKTSPIQSKMYSACGNRDTFSSFNNPITGSYAHPSTDLEHAMSRFYANLLGAQEPLEHDFETVLYANLWDLYES
ncbi:MAG: hypothetical protein HZB64_06790 [Rhodocyclales bacterium]|nr:hypothetical protein [Rhodocyclales bacterium]